LQLFIQKSALFGWVSFRRNGSDFAKGQAPVFFKYFRT
jgi:hypothetical protein